MPIAEMIAAFGVDARQLTIFGQVAGLISAVLLFFWGSAGWKVNRNGAVSSPSIDARLQGRRRVWAVRWIRFRYLFLSKVALGLLFVAFLLQFLALWAPSPQA